MKLYCKGELAAKNHLSEYTRLYFTIQDLLTMIDSNSLNVKHLHPPQLLFILDRCPWPRNHQAVYTKGIQS